MIIMHKKIYYEDVFSMLLIIIFYIIKPKIYNLPNEKIQIDGSILLVTAHPDDESMFFAPLLQTINPKNLTILCISNCNLIREKEIKDLSKEYLFDVITTKRFKDSHNWCSKDITNLISFLDILHNFETIFTFDKNGVSGHKNHISCFLGVLNFYRKNKHKKIFTLKSVNLIQKYLTHNYKPDASQKMIRITAKKYVEGLKMMFYHSSQMVWFRYLYLLFSVYMRENTFIHL